MKFPNSLMMREPIPKFSNFSELVFYILPS